MMKKSDKYKYIVDYFSETQPDVESELNYNSPYELLVATMLAAQCTDKRVNMVTPALFEAYPDAGSMAEATEEEVLRYIKSVSYPNSKSRHLVGMAKMLVDEFGGEVPCDVNELQRLPGVGRKTANVMAAVEFNQPAMPVDTHVFRVSNRIGLTHNSKTPLETERELVKHIPPEKLPTAHHWLILHGRYVCQARKPHCEECGIRDICEHYRKEGGCK